MEASGFHPGRSAANHLRAVAVAAGVAPARVGEVLSLVGLAEFAKRRARALSFGMRQRLALATALLGQPSVLLLDEPANGLDPEAINWLRGFLRSFADGGGTVLVSSHVLAEVAQLVDEVVIVAKGRLVVQTSLAALGERGTRAVRVRTPQARALQAALADQGLPAEVQGTDQVVARGVPPERVGHLAAESGIVIYAMASEGASLEETFLALTGEAE
jgi:ABC-2 type transport system ATP-binding protein